jgi:hypothetical protein
VNGKESKTEDGEALEKNKVTPPPRLAFKVDVFPSSFVPTDQSAHFPGEIFRYIVSRMD